ncbi:hypothetical protein L289_0451 [Acinetobacter gerneri DSM 14967 = CIP 107464 = MTCC 9824]|nr:hypothetical protein L289_0451 [Acinetobacter gerneri DSM 14967 = CIP 107464 = MTCC 9824]
MMSTYVEAAMYAHQNGKDKKEFTDSLDKTDKISEDTKLLYKGIAIMAYEKWPIYLSPVEKEKVVKLYSKIIYDSCKE